MRKVFPLLILTVLFFFSNNSFLRAQQKQEQLLFVFPSAEKLINALESKEVKEISFTITGIRSADQAKNLESSILAAGKWVSACSFKKAGKGIYNGKMTLIPEAHTSHFTKVLINSEIQEIVVNGEQIRTVDLNDKQKYSEQ